VFGGGPPAVGVAESYNGTSWTETGDLNTAREKAGGAGTQTDALAFGGAPPAKTVTESFDGSTWTEVADLATARTAFAHNGTANDAFAAGSPPAVVSSEEWTRALTAKTVTVS
jgi:hypothetical protein